MEIFGTVHAVFADDGSVAVALTTVRRTASANATIQGDGRVQFRTKVRETAALLLPDLTGRLAVPSGGSIDVGRLYAGHHLSLYVRVEAAR